MMGLLRILLVMKRLLETGVAEGTESRWCDWVAGTEGGIQPGGFSARDVRLEFFS